MRSREEILRNELRAVKKMLANSKIENSELKDENRKLKQECSKYKEIVINGYRW